MASVAPCITVASLDEYRQAIAKLEPFAERVHVDVSDGEFAPVQLLGVDQLYWPPAWHVDVHAMVNKPSLFLPYLLQLQPKTIIFHAEVEEDLIPLMQQVKQMGIRAGVALKKTTVPKSISQIIEQADYALIFSGDLGHYGGEASLMQLEKVRLIRLIHPTIEIGWDGGASVENIFSLVQGGIDVINTGGAVNNAENPEEVYRKMVAEANKQGVI